MLNIIIAVTAGYLIVMPILFRLAAFLHKKLLIEKRAQKIKGNNAQALKNLPKPLWPKWQELLKFALKDKRDLVLGKPKKGKGGEPTSSKMTNKQAFFLFHLISLAISIVGAVVGIWWVILIGYIGFFMTLQWAMKTAKPIIETRRKVLDRMFSIGQSKLGLSMEHKDNPQAVIEVLEWNDYVKPQKVRYQVPDNFGAEGEEGFLRQFNQLFGAETAWVPSPDMEADPPTPGWDYQSGQATFHAVPPLPTMAPWSERYVLSPGIHWAFFPLALGVENGVELMNEESGELEYVLGFDLSGEQAKEGKKHGLKVSPTITTSPMCLKGDTQLLLANGDTITFEDLVKDFENIEVPSVNSQKEIVNKPITNAMMTGENKEIVRVSLKGGGYVDCTPDHTFLTIDGFYEPAESLIVGQKLYSVDGKNIEIDSVVPNGFANVYNAEVLNTSNFIIIPRGVGDIKKIVLHNCFIGGGTGGGKSLSVDTLVEVVKFADR